MKPEKGQELARFARLSGSKFQVSGSKLE